MWINKIVCSISQKRLTLEAWGTTAWWSWGQWCLHSPKMSRYGSGEGDRGRMVQLSERCTKRLKPLENVSRKSEWLGWGCSGEKGERRLKKKNAKGTSGTRSGRISMLQARKYAWALPQRQWGPQLEDLKELAVFWSEDHYGSSMGNMLEGNDGENQ